MSEAIDDTAGRLYGLLPAHTRSADAVAGAPLYGYLRALATGAVTLDAEIDRLLANLFVETADALGLANLARLVGAETLAELPPGAPFSLRAFIANTVRYRRAKGTPRALEGLAADVGGAGAVVVEYFQRLVRTAALLDPRPERPALAPLTDGDTGARIGRAFDRLARLADLRSIARAGGRLGVPNVGVHVVRLVAPEFAAASGDPVAPSALAGVPALLPRRDAGADVPGYFQLSPFPDARVPLVNPDRRAEAAGGRIIEPARIDRLRRLPLHREVEAARLAAVKGLTPPAPHWFAAGQPFTLYARHVGDTQFHRVPPEQIGICRLDGMTAGHPRPAATLAYAWRDAGAPSPVARNGSMPIAAGFDPATGRVVTATPASPAAEIAELRLAHAYGQGAPIGAGPYQRNDASVPFEVATSDFLRVVDPTAAPGPPFVASLAAALADWAAATTARRGFIVLARCDAEQPAAALQLAMRAETELHIAAAIWQEKRIRPGVADVATRRGYIVRRDRRFILTAPLRVAPAPSPPGSQPGALVLDGLAIAGGVVLAQNALSELRLRYVTLRASTLPALRLEAPAAGLAVRIEDSITGAVVLQGDGTLAASRVIVTPHGAAASIDAPGFDTTLSEATLLGASTCKSLEATGVIFAAPVTVTRRQAGCVRYSYLAPNSLAPRRFRCQPDLAVAERRRLQGGLPLDPSEEAGLRLGLTPIFLDTNPDEPSFALLSPRCAAGIRAGGEGGKEMGVFARTGEPMRRGNVTTLFDDYVPVALEAAILDDTTGAAATHRRTIP